MIVDQNRQDKQEFDLAFPEKMFGYHSSWSLKESGFRDGFKFNRRMGVKLKTVKAQFFGYDPNDLSLSKCKDYIWPPLIKTDTNTTNSFFEGLSSGHGSSLFRFNNVTLKLKRCGYKHGPPTREFFQQFCRSFNIVNDSLVENHISSYRGVMQYVDAEHECRVATLLGNAGLCRAYIPLGVFKLAPSSSYPKDTAIAVFKISSDTRIDELIFAALGPMLLELLATRTLTFNKTECFFVAKNLKLNHILDVFASAFEFLSMIGKVSGANYKHLHNQGFFRGAGSAWFGNEVVDLDGTLSFVDFDGGTIPCRQFSSRDQEKLMFTEAYRAAACFFMFFRFLETTLFEYIGSLLMHNFLLGYARDHTTYKIDANALNECLEKYAHVHLDLHQHLFES